MTPQCSFARNLIVHLSALALALGAGSVLATDVEPISLKALDGIVAPAPKNADDARGESLCEGEARTAKTTIEQALAGSGWLLFGEPIVVGTTTVVTAAAYLDGQCRPRGVTGFVFTSDGRAVAQVGPSDPMVYPSFSVIDANTIEVTATGFGPNDPACCPTVRYASTVRLTDGKATISPTASKKK